MEEGVFPPPAHAISSPFHPSLVNLVTALNCGPHFQHEQPGLALFPELNSLVCADRGLCPASVSRAALGSCVLMPYLAGLGRDLDMATEKPLTPFVLLQGLWGD